MFFFLNLMIITNIICSKTLSRKFWKSSISYIMKRTFSHKTTFDKIIFKIAQRHALNFCDAKGLTAYSKIISKWYFDKKNCLLTLSLQTLLFRQTSYKDCKHFQRGSFISIKTKNLFELVA